MTCYCYDIVFINYFKYLVHAGDLVINKEMIGLIIEYKHSKRIIYYNRLNKYKFIICFSFSIKYLVLQIFGNFKHSKD